MIKLLTIIGARPQIIKAAAISRAIREKFADRVEERILHTGQHYDENMSQVFFDELGIPQPHYNLGVGSGCHGVQTARMITGIEEVLLKEHFDGIILYGDTNSTLAGTVAASKLHVPVYHVEAGLRSFNMGMPEEVNRIVCDNLSTILFTPTQTGMDNLQREGFTDVEHPRRFADCRTQKVVLSGDVMYDNSMYFASMAEEKCDILQRLGLEDKNFVLATIHRPANTDSAENLTSIFRALADIAEEERIRVLLPLHPRTRRLLPEKLPSELLQRVEHSAFLQLTEPASFFEIICLERHARLVMTDSGGVQKEAFFFRTPCVILRPETEWVEIVEAGAGIIADADYDRIRQAYHTLCGHEVPFPALFGDAHAAEHILDCICSEGAE